MNDPAVLGTFPIWKKSQKILTSKPWSLPTIIMSFAILGTMVMMWRARDSVSTSSCSELRRWSVLAVAAALALTSSSLLRRARMSSPFSV